MTATRPRFTVHYDRHHFTTDDANDADHLRRRIEAGDEIEGTFMARVRGGWSGSFKRCVLNTAWLCIEDGGTE